MKYYTSFRVRNQEQLRQPFGYIVAGIVSFGSKSIPKDEDIRKELPEDLKQDTLVLSIDKRGPYDNGISAMMKFPDMMPKSFLRIDL